MKRIFIQVSIYASIRLTRNVHSLLIIIRLFLHDNYTNMINFYYKKLYDQFYTAISNFMQPIARGWIT